MYIWDRKIVKEVEIDWSVEVTFDNKSKEKYTKISLKIIKTEKPKDLTELSDIWSNAISKDITKVISKIDLSKYIDNVRTVWEMTNELEKIELEILRVVMWYGASISITLKSLTTLDNLYNIIIKKATNSLQFSINKAIIKPFWVDYQDQVNLLQIDEALRK